MIKTAILFFLLMAVYGCQNASQKNNDQAAALTVEILKGQYAYDASFIKSHNKNVVELISDDSNAKILLSADYQGRVMTSTATGDTGISFGWINYDLISSGEKKKHINPVGGEERFWMGPEGGQYSIYFKLKDSFSFNNWQVPAFIDTDNYEVKQADRKNAVFTKQSSVTNYSGTVFNLFVERKISLLDRENTENKLHTAIPQGLNFVAYETDNKITNTGANDWTKNKGLLSVWLLGMFTPSPKTTVIIPFHAIPNARSNITDNYFGNIPAERLQVKDSILYFTCDGKFRSKIGLSPLIAKPVAAGFDFEKNVLTVVIPQVSKDASYVNSKWELQKEPFKGDVINSYNDGPLEDGTQMGPFYEIESSSAALALKKGETTSYKQTTCHFTGDYSLLKQLAEQLLHINIDELKN